MVRMREKNLSDATISSSDARYRRKMREGSERLLHELKNEHGAIIRRLTKKEKR